MQSKGWGKQFHLFVVFHLFFSSSDTSLKTEIEIKLKIGVLQPKYFMVLAKLFLIDVSLSRGELNFRTALAKNILKLCEPCFGRTHFCKMWFNEWPSVYQCHLYNEEIQHLPENTDRRKALLSNKFLCCGRHLQYQEEKYKSHTREKWYS